jgi:CHAT domain-containing protein
MLGMSERPNRRLIAFSLVFTALLFPLSASAINDPVDEVDRAFASGRFGEMVNLLEPQIGELVNGKSEQLVRLCFAYSKIKSYKKLDACLDELAKKISAGDRSGGKYGSWWAGPTWFVTSRMPSGLMFGTKDWDITPYPHIMRAEASIDQGDYPRAVAEAQLAQGKLTSNQTQGNYFQIDVLGLLAMAHALSGQNEKARRYIDELAKLDITSFGTSSAEIYLRTTLARTLFAVKDFKKALEVISRDKTSGLRAMASAFANTRGGESLWRWEEVPRDYMRYKCELEIGRTREAKLGFDKLLGQAQIRDHSGLYWMLLHDRGRIAALEGDADTAISYFKQAVEAIEQLRATINTEASRIGYVADKQEAYSDLIRLLVAKGNAASAFEYVERSKARALVDILASKQDFVASGLDTVQVRQILTRLDAADTAARTQSDSTNPGDTAGGRNLEVTRQAIRETASELASLVTVSPVPTVELQALLGPDEALVEYYYQGHDFYAFILDRNRIQVVSLDGARLGQEVQAFREAVADPASDRWQTSARTLYRRLWTPVALMVKARNVIVVSHGVLHYLPFAALQDSGGKFLIDQIGMRYLPNASVLKFLHPAIGKKALQVLVLGNPDLGDPKLDLKFAESEARVVAGLFPDSRLLIRKDASVTNFLQAAGLSSRLHFATHGKFQSDSPLSSGLYLAKDERNDGLLSVGRLYSLNLDLDLVTLSACETGLGKISNGDDVVGLNRGFLYAGSRSVVGSLWSVDDEATAALMKAFYINLATRSKREALRQAQISTRQNFPHPFFWAAFQLTGQSE